jgi:hypothetical protein
MVVVGVLFKLYCATRVLAEPTCIFAVIMGCADACSKCLPQA